MISAGVEGQIPPYMMTYQRWGAQKQEFVRPAPKPLPSRCNGVTSNAPNGTRLSSHSTRSILHHQPPAATPVNLTQHKDELPDEQYYAQRVYQTTFNPYHQFTNLYQPYSLIRSTTGYAPPLSPLETYSPTTPTGNGSFLPPQVPPFSPPTSHKSLSSKSSPGASIPPFKVPSGKEGSLKHRILIRPEDVPAPSSQLEKLRETRNRIAASATVVSPPRSPAKSSHNNNNGVSAKFAKGSLIQLADGKMRNVEDMRTEDFLRSAELSSELRLAESTVLKIAENPITGTATITLSYNRGKAQVEVESPLEHPFFVYGKRWASCNVDRTMKSYGLEVSLLCVGDVLISLMPRESSTSYQQPPSSTSNSTIVTTSTSTLPTAHHIPSNAKENRHHQHLVNNLIKNNKEYSNTASPSQHSAPMSPDSMRKRRWSAPDQICDDDEQQHAARRMRVE